MRLIAKQSCDPGFFRHGIRNVLFSPRQRSGRRFLLAAAPIALLCAMPEAVSGATVGANSTVLVSNIGSNDTIALQGGTLQIDKTGTYGNAVTLQGSSTAAVTSTIDSHGNTGTFSGVFADASTTSFPGALVITDSVGGGEAVFTGVSTYSGATTVNTGATLALTGTGSIASSSSVTANGTFDISQTSSGTSIVSLAGSGSVILGAQTLSISNASTVFSGTISGSGGLLISGGTQIIDSTQTYTGGTTISRGTLQLGNGDAAGMILGNVAVAGTLAFDRTDDISFTGLISGSGGVTQSGTDVLTLTQAETYSGATTVSSGTLTLVSGASIANSSGVATDGTFDISATGGTSIKSLSGTGTVNLGGATLTLTNASGTFSGVIQGTGGIVVQSGTEILSGTNTYTGATTVTGGTLEMGAAIITGDVANSGTFGFYSSGNIAMSGVVSGTGALIQVGTGVTTLTAAQTYTGTTTISAGTLALSGSGAIASSSGLVDNGTFDISAASGDVRIAALSGTGAVQLGGTNLILTNASGTFAGSISGSGGVTLAGGKETLSGTSSFTGQTVIAAGTLYLSGASPLASSSGVVDNAALDISGAGSLLHAGTTITSLSGSGTVYLGAATLELSSASDVFSGVISGTGGVTIDGGVETITGVNTYTGTTTINGGTLALSGAGRIGSGAVADSGIFDISAANGAITIASLSGSGTVNLGTNGLTLNNAVDTFSGAITGSGSLTISGGTEVLTGTSTYTGGTIITSGTLQLGNGVTGGAIVGDVTDNGVLAFSQASTSSATFAGIISGSGSLVQYGPGTIALTAANTYTGGTLISGGTLQIGNGGNTGWIIGDVTDNGMLAFDRSDPITFSGTISGSGDVTQTGSGALTLVTANSYTGTTTVNSGSELIVSGGGSIAASSEVLVNGTFDVSAANGATTITSLSGSGTVVLGAQSLLITNASGSFAGAISGSGSVNLTGGAETLSGTSSYTGATVVNGGTLTVNGAITSSSGVTVNSGGTLAGSGSVPDVTVKSGGILAPTGALKVDGNLAFENGSTYKVNVSSASSSTVTVTGQASLGGALDVVSTDGTYPLGQKITILTASGGATGSFTLDPISSSGAEFKGTLSSDSNNTYLEIDLAKLSPLLPGSATGNQAAPVAGIDRAIAAGDALSSSFQNLGNLTSSGLASAADQLSGEIGSQVARAGNQLFSAFTDALSDHAILANQSTASLGPRRSLWLAGWAGSNVVGPDMDGSGAHKFDSVTTGLVAGLDWQASQALTVGAAIAVGNADFHIADSLGSGRVSGIELGGYGFLRFTRSIYGQLTAGLAFNQTRTDRSLTISGSDSLRGQADSMAFGARYESGIHMRWFSPYAAVEDHLLTEPGYAETAAAGAATFALAYQSGTMNFADIELGLRQSGDIRLDRDWMISLSDRLAWRDDTAGHSLAQARFANLAGSDFTVYGATPGGGSGLLSVGAQLKYRQSMSIGARLDSSVAANAQTYMGIADIRVSW
jgi:autotransporter-associated beta strand protein